MTIDRKKTKKLIEKALKEFPKIVKEKEKIMKRFMPMAKSLARHIQSKDRALIIDSDEMNKMHPWGEDETRCSEIRSFPDQHPCFNYWQCLPTKGVSMGCKDIGNLGDYGHTGQVDLRVEDKNGIHHYFTRRNYDLETCESWIYECLSLRSRFPDISLKSGLAPIPTLKMPRSI
jgi:hypothetical protein